MEAPSRKEEEAREETASAEYPSSNCVDDHSTLCSKLSGECSSINSMTLWLHEQLQIDKEKSPQDIALHLWAIRDASNIGCISYFLGQKYKCCLFLDLVYTFLDRRTLLSNLVFTNYLAFLDFTGLSLDRALRYFTLASFPPIKNINFLACFVNLFIYQGKASLWSTFWKHLPIIITPQIPSLLPLLVPFAVYVSSCLVFI